jgi:hypothetical protein
MLHPCPTQSIHTGILAASPSLFSSQSTSPTRSHPRQRGQIRVSRPIRSKSRSESKGSIQVSRPYPSQPARSDPSRNPSPKGRSESACLIRVVRHDLSRPTRSESARTDPILCRPNFTPSPSRWPLLPPVRSSHGGHRSPVRYLKEPGGQRLQSHR